MKCFLDMDGILVDFNKGACDFHKIKVDLWPEGEWDTAKVLKLTQEEFWKFDSHNFWANLEKMPECDQIIAICNRHFGPENVCLLSSPSYNPGCASGKLEWIYKNIPQFKRHFVFTPQKRFFAQSNALLIDDQDKNVDTFYNYGGHSFLYPQVWNRMFHDYSTETKLDMLEDFVKAFIEGNSSDNP